MWVRMTECRRRPHGRGGRAQGAPCSSCLGLSWWRHRAACHPACTVHCLGARSASNSPTAAPVACTVHPFCVQPHRFVASLPTSWVAAQPRPAHAFVARENTNVRVIFLQCRRCVWIRSRSWLAGSARHTYGVCLLSDMSLLPSFFSSPSPLSLACVPFGSQDKLAADLLTNATASAHTCVDVGAEGAFGVCQLANWAVGDSPGVSLWANCLT